MKIAICLSGAPRFKHKSLFKLLNLIKGFDKADFFIRTWKTDEYGNTAEEFVNYLKSNGLDSPKYDYKVVQLLDDNAENAPPPRMPMNIAPWAPNLLILWWGVVKCFELFENYVAETGEKYDLVFRMRTDMMAWEYSGTGNDYKEYTQDIDITPYNDPNKIYNARNFADNFLFGTPEMYKKYVGYWEFMDNFAIANAFIHPEESLELYFQIEEIDYECIPVWVAPWSDPDEYKVRNR
jgi:hypothetical protein